MRILRVSSPFRITHALNGEMHAIFAIADVWDALSHDRPYNKAWSREKIIEYFIEQTGKHFDPVIIKIFLVMVEKGEI